MMENIHEIALNLAEKSLAKGFDADAYIVKYVAEKCLKKDSVLSNIDLVPESNIDEEIHSMLDMFIVYMGEKTEDNLRKMLVQSQQILSEIYQTCETDGQRDLCEKYFDNNVKL